VLDRGLAAKTKTHQGRGYTVRLMVMWFCQTFSKMCHRFF